MKFKSSDNIVKPKKWQKDGRTTDPIYQPVVVEALELKSEQHKTIETVPSIPLIALLDGKPLVETDVRELAAQLVLSVGVIHDNHMVHCGLSLDVLSLDWKGVLKITDYSSCEAKGKHFRPSTSSKFPYIAPEILLGRPYDVACDWWSVGAILYEMITGKPIYVLDEKIILEKMGKYTCKEIINDILLAPIDYDYPMSKEAKSLLKSFLEKDGSKRLKWTRSDRIEPIIRHPFFASINWDHLRNTKCIGKVNMDLSQCQWSPECITVEKLLGEENGVLFGRFYKIRQNDNKQNSVLKLVWKSKMRQTANGWKQVMNERLIWQKLSTEHLSYIAKSAPLPEEVSRLISAQIILIIEACHKSGILLRNLSSDSFLIENSGRIALGDFEYAKFTKYSNKRCPALEFASPEAIQSIEYSKEADWWAMGIILFQLSTGQTPLSIYCGRRDLNVRDADTETLLRAIESIPKLLEDIQPPDLSHLLREILRYAPEDRLSGRKFSTIKDHPFYRTFDWKKLSKNRDYFNTLA